LVSIVPFTNHCTTLKERITYARVLITAEVLVDLPEEVLVRDPTYKLLVQNVHYK